MNYLLLIAAIGLLVLSACSEPAPPHQPIDTDYVENDTETTEEEPAAGSDDEYTTNTGEESASDDVEDVDGALEDLDFDNW